MRYKENKILVITFVILILIGTVFSFTSCQELKYSPGRDTYELFGDGTYQILCAPDKTYVLHDCDNSNNIEEYIYRYRKISPLVYVVGKNGYTILNYETGIIEQKSDINDFSDKDREIFQKETKFKRLKKQ